MTHAGRDAFTAIEALQAAVGEQERLLLQLRDENAAALTREQERLKKPLALLEQARKHLQEA